MKIVFFTNAYKPLVNGVVTIIRLYYEELRKKGHEVYIFAPSYKNWQDEDKNILRFPAVNLSSQIYFPIAIPYYPGLRSLLRKINPDIIHTHHPFVLGKVGMKQANILSIPCVYTFHTQYEQYSHYFPAPEKLVKWGSRTIIRNYAQKVDLLLTPTHSTAQLLSDYGITREIKVLANPIDIKPFQNADRESIRKRYGIGDAQLFVSLGRLGKEKNIELMLKSFAMLNAKTNRDLRLMLVGSGPWEEYLRQYAAELGIAEKTIFAGMAKYEDVPNFYSAADYFLMTSTTETFGLVTLEAMAAGLPVIAVKASGTEDIVTSGLNGLLTAPDPDEFTAAIEKLIEDEPLRMKLSKSAKETAARYSIENITQEMVDLYQIAILKKAARK